MNKFINGCDYGISFLGVAFSLDNIETILGIVILVLSIINILYKLFLNIREHYKNKKYKEIGNDVSEAIDELNNIKKGKENND